MHHNTAKKKSSVLFSYFSKSVLRSAQVHLPGQEKKMECFATKTALEKMMAQTRECKNGQMLVVLIQYQDSSYGPKPPNINAAFSVKCH